MARHSSMPPRVQKTPHGDVTLTSRWKHDRYYLVAAGGFDALHWLFPKVREAPEAHGPSFRRMFAPSPKPITVERDLRRACAAWQAKWMERLEDGDASGDLAGSARPPIATLGQLFDHQYEARRSMLKCSTIDRDRYRLLVWRDTLGDKVPLASLTAESISLALKAIAAKTSPSTANTALGVLKTYLTWAANMGLLRDFSHRTVKRLREPASQRHHREWWTSVEVELALQVAAKDSHQPTATLLVACGCYLGLRPEEIIMLRWQGFSLDAVDPKTGQPKPVCHVTAHNGWEPKDGESRDIPVCVELLGILLRLRRPEGFLLNREPHRPGRPRGGKGWIYRYDPKATWARLMKAVEAAGGKRITMYGMRHSFASNFLIAGVSDVKVSRWLGHSDTRMLHRHYGHLLSYDDDINAINRVRCA